MTGKVDVQKPVANVHLGNVESNHHEDRSEDLENVAVEAVMFQKRGGCRVSLHNDVLSG